MYRINTPVFELQGRSLGHGLPPPHDNQHFEKLRQKDEYIRTQTYRQQVQFPGRELQTHCVGKRTKEQQYPIYSDI